MKLINNENITITGNILNTIFFNKGFSQEINSRINSILIQQTSESLPDASITVIKGNEIIFSKQYEIPSVKVQLWCCITNI